MTRHQLQGMTEATGSLTPDDPDEAFVPAERREIADPGSSRDLTAATHRRREGRRGTRQFDPGSLMGRDPAIPLNDRDGGYGSEHGLSGDDPAYRELVHLPGDANAGARPRRGIELGGDERSDPADDRF